MVMYYLILNTIIFLLFLIGLYKLSKIYINYNRRKVLYDNLPIILAIVDTARDIAYKRLFREDILAYNLSGYRVGNKELILLKRKYITQIIKYIGPKVMYDIELLNGNIDSFIEKELSSFVLKLDDDQNLTFNVRRDGFENEPENK